MGGLHYVFGFLLLALICVKNSSSIKCYECNSASDKRCLGDQNNKLSDDLIKPCPKREGKEYTLCRKIKQVIDFEVNGLLPDSRVIRTCGYDDSQYADRCYQKSGFGGRQEVCTCRDQNACNSSSTLIASASLIFGLVIFLKINI